MAKRPNAKGKTIDFVLKGSDSGPGRGKKVKTVGATLYDVDRGEETLASSQPGSGRVFPPVYGSSKDIGLNQKKKLKKKGGGGYVPSATDLTNSPSPF